MKILIILIYFGTCSAQFFDVFQKLDLDCIGEGAFMCADGKCIGREKYCDGIDDCLDGSDENMCPNHHPDGQICNETHQFLCTDGLRCIPAAWVCNDDTDCDDASDETNCTTAVINNNSTCKGFLCDATRCISTLWMCDGNYDCDDKSDEDILNTCRHFEHSRRIYDGVNCPSRAALSLNDTEYRCSDKSFCLRLQHMCDGINDCRDGSDEGPFCDHWYTMCNNFTCHGDGSFCKPSRTGEVCQCKPMQRYNAAAASCEPADQCQEDRPVCSHKCINQGDHFKCQCDHGYFPDFAQYLCFAPDPEPLLFFSTRTDIRYMRLKSKDRVVVASGLKQAHGVSYDGTHVFWVEAGQGRQSIYRAKLDNVTGTMQVITAMGLEDPDDIAVDYLGGNVYFTDAGRRAIGVCKDDGSMCTILPAHTMHPRFITLDPRNGKMYWSDWFDHAVIAMASMDGTRTETLVDELVGFATGLALDASNGRLYFVDQTIKAVKLDNRRVYSIFEEPFHHPYALSVFENTIYWCDWTSNTIQTADKIHETTNNRHILLQLNVPIYDMQVYHPVMMSRILNPCDHNYCSHFCFVTSPTNYTCGCPEGMEIKEYICHTMPNYHARYIILAARNIFTRVQYNAFNTPDANGVTMNIGNVQAMAYDSINDVLYVYDGQRKVIYYIRMEKFNEGKATLYNYGAGSSLENVVDMAFEYVSSTLYVLDAGRKLVEVISLRNKQRVLLNIFEEQEVPISFCLIPEYGRALVALVDSEENEIHIYSFGLDGNDRQLVDVGYLSGPYVIMRYCPYMDRVYISDEGRGTIEEVHPAGTGKQSFRSPLSPIASLAVTDTHVFWAERRLPKLYWADVHDAVQRTRRIEFSMFPTDTRLHILSTQPTPALSDSLKNHKCAKDETPCSHVCLQTSHQLNAMAMGYTCACPPGMHLVNDTCIKMMRCKADELYCHKGNECLDKHKRCDGVKDCIYGEDEEGCPKLNTTICRSDQILCQGTCISKNNVCEEQVLPTSPECGESEVKCATSSVCINRALVCDGQSDCPDASDESPAKCNTMDCLESEFMCGSGNCIPLSWRCDRSSDCEDGTDEIDCVNKTCGIGYFQCKNDDCVPIEKRCDHTVDCQDSSDEEDCDLPDVFDIPNRLPSCKLWEYACELNKSICLPYTARCNAKYDCPGGTDENDCDFRCAPSGGFGCKQEYKCISMQHVCNGRKECSDGSDETLEACARVNRTGAEYAKGVVPNADCRVGYHCKSKGCVEWKKVCDSHPDCEDGSDENGLCSSPCTQGLCPQFCHRSPQGPLCVCSHGYEARNGSCVDIDECERHVCSHVCLNTPGHYVCSCHHGYGLRSDRHSCKALRGRASIVYSSGSEIWTIFPRQTVRDLEYRETNNRTISSMDFDIRRRKLYLVLSESKELVELDVGNRVTNKTVVSNVGTPTLVRVEWITGNVYVVDGTPSAGNIRVCSFHRRACARILPLPTEYYRQVTALSVDPINRLIFYCINGFIDSEVHSCSLAGLDDVILAVVPPCTGLAADSFSRTLYVAGNGRNGSVVQRLSYDGLSSLTVALKNDHLHHIEGLHIFEDHAYTASHSNLTRCLLFGTKRCTQYGYLPNATSFMIVHESIQRDDMEDACVGFRCNNVCVLGHNGPQCVCADGRFSPGACVDKLNELALFNGVLREQYSSHSISIALVTVVALLFLVYLAVLIHYHRGRCNKNTPGSYLQVRYRNSTATMQIPNASVEMPQTVGSGHEFVNPLQFVRNIWNESFYKKPRPVGTAGLVFETQRDFSDTESDLDIRENRAFLINNN